MVRNRVALLLVAAALLSWIVRMNNAWTYPSLRAFDGYGHFIYIWFMAENWRVPLPTSGWSFFHPPLYYWMMASIWSVFDQVDPVSRLRIGSTITATLGMTQAIVAYAVTRRYFPGKPLLHVLAAVLMLFLPVHLFTAGYLGNEGLNAVICTLSVATLLWVLREPGVRRGIVLGMCLGAAMLTKFTAVAFVAGAFASLAVHTLVTRQWKRGIAVLLATGMTLLSICGWFYARNILEYGDPFKVSRDEFLVRRHENLQSTGRRDFLEYVLFDPLIVVRPQWPRGIPLSGDLPPGATHSRLRESVWTGLFANAFFDAVGAQVLPLVTHSEESRRAGQIMLSLGLVPLAAVLIGIWTAVGRLVRRGWDATVGPILINFTAMILIFIQATSVVPMNAAVKATYMTPAAVLFAFWFAMGVDRIVQRWKWMARVFVAWAVVFVIASVVVFSNSVFIARDFLKEASTDSPVWRSIYGVVYYAAGWRDRAREMFESGARSNWHTGYENLATMALEDGRPLEALYHLRSAAKYQVQQAYGVPADRITYNRITRAEYLNSLAVIYHELGWKTEALTAAQEAYRLDPTIPEVSFDLAVLLLDSAIEADGALDESRLAAVLPDIRRLLAEALSADGAFFDAKAILGVAAVLEGRCDEGAAMIREALAPHPGQYRFYPVHTGQGDIQAAAIGRRRHITRLPARLQPETASSCSGRG